MRRRLDRLGEKTDEMPPAVKDRLRALKGDTQQSQPEASAAPAASQDTAVDDEGNTIPAVILEVEAFKRDHDRLPVQSKDPARAEEKAMRKRLDHLEENLDKLPSAVKDRLRVLREDFQHSQQEAGSGMVFPWGA